MDILIVVVLYNKDINKLTYLNELENVRILIYDNSPNPQIVNDSFVYIHDSENSGVSKAYNIGAKFAKNEGIEYFIILDQDTIFDNTILSEYRAAKSKYNTQYIYAPKIVGNNNKIYSPFQEATFRNIPFSMKTFNSSELLSLQGISLINSGLMIPIKIFDEIGGFNEKIKLDFSDTYFIDQYKKVYKTVVLLNLEIKHSLSGDEDSSKHKEIKRFQYFCEGALEYKNSTGLKKRTNKLVLYRTLRLITKYKTVIPLKIMVRKYLNK